MNAVKSEPWNISRLMTKSDNWQRLGFSFAAFRYSIARNRFVTLGNKIFVIEIIS